MADTFHEGLRAFMKTLVTRAAIVAVDNTRK